MTLALTRHDVTVGGKARHQMEAAVVPAPESRSSILAAKTEYADAGRSIITDAVNSGIAPAVAKAEPVGLEPIDEVHSPPNASIGPAGVNMHLWMEWN